MSSGVPAIMACSAVIILIFLSAGCTSTTIGDVAYRNGTIDITVTGTNDSEEAFVQVTVYEIRNLHQQEMTVFSAPATLRRGENKVLVPGMLPPGNYKLYVYVLKPGERRTATIRDIVV
jgi:hypothetical protein